MDVHVALVLLFIAFTAYSLVSRKLEASVLSGPMLFTALGYGFHLTDATLTSPLDNSVVEFLATATLAIILYRDAANIRVSSVMAKRATALLSARLLFIGIPLTILAGTAAGMFLFPALGLFGALVLAIVLTPTDAALAQPVFGNDGLPEVEREALDVESGLNDGLCLPLLLIALALAADTGGGEGMAGHAAFFLKQVVFGPLVGLAAGYLAPSPQTLLLHAPFPTQPGARPSWSGLPGSPISAQNWRAATDFLPPLQRGWPLAGGCLPKRWRRRAILP